MHILIAVLLSCFGPAHAQDIEESSLEDLLNMKTSVASKKEVSARETPGSVTLITDEEIHNMGARDLIDVLSTVPSLQFAADTQGIVGIGARGMWGQEGKILLIVDGIEMNELQYAGLQFGNEFPVTQIKRIEIIRGPGSAIYGGFAELAVINIVTKSGADLHGGSVAATYGRMVHTDGRHNLGLQGGGVLGHGWDVSAAGYVGAAKRGDGTYTGYHDDPNAPPPFSGSFEFKDADVAKPKYLNLGAHKDGLNLRFLYSDYYTTTRAMYDFTGLDADLPNEFVSYNFLANYDWKLSDKFKITPQVSYAYQIPWRQESDLATSIAKTFNVHSERLKGGVTASYDLTSRINLLAGAEGVADHHHIVSLADSTGQLTFRSGKRTADYGSQAYFAQSVVDLDWANVTVGARFEDPDFTKDSFVPRLGITRAFADWHYKLLYAQAFRTPVLFNIDAKPDIRPEKTETLEGEIGHTVSQRGYVTLNLFTTRVKDPIVYFYDNTLGDQYDNFGEVGTRGFELNYRLKPDWGQMQLGYAYYEINHNNVDYYAVPDHSRALLAMPQQKATLNSTINLGSPQLKLNPSVIWVGPRFGYAFDSMATGMTVHRTPAQTLVNLFLQRENFIAQGLSGGIGVFNLLGEDSRFIQAYNGGMSPLPGPSREFVARAEYHF